MTVSTAGSGMRPAGGPVPTRPRPVPGRAGLVADGVEVTVRVPATSANLGPGFDSLGLALGLHDEVRLRLRPGGVAVAIQGEGAGRLPGGENHLVVRAVRAGFAHAGVPQPGLDLLCRNGIPHSRGLGSSAAAVVAGLVAARGCLAEPECLDDAAVLALAADFEGHPDNAAAVLYGGLTVSWVNDGRPRAARCDPDPAIRPALFVPERGLSTRRARAMLPGRVTHADAAFNAGRSALLVLALTRRPDLLLEATEDRLHQQRRASAMPATADLIARLRAAGAAAVVSGAGPSVLVLAAEGGEAAEGVLESARRPGWRVLRPGVDLAGATCATRAR
jgi:homoserine kinase